MSSIGPSTLPLPVGLEGLPGDIELNLVSGCWLGEDCERRQERRAANGRKYSEHPVFPLLLL
ncbi:MAG TPA: hypothetical protein VGI91_09170 [Steroidobacteraceae bacterium]|jgi:hypothetical protein